MTLTTIIGAIAVAGLVAWLVKDSVAGVVEHLPPFPVVVAVIVGLLWFSGYHTAASIVVVVSFAGYVVENVMFPWRPCPGCNATGKQWSPLTRTFRTCRRCGGLTKIVRLGRRLWTSSTDVNEKRK